MDQYIYNNKPDFREKLLLIKLFSCVIANKMPSSCVGNLQIEKAAFLLKLLQLPRLFQLLIPAAF